MASLINRWPLTANANDVVGSLNLTNNGTVTFSADGASFNGSSQSLSGTKSAPAAFTLTVWVEPTSWANAPSPMAAYTSSNNGWGFEASSGAMHYQTYYTSSQLSVSSEFNSTNYPNNSFTLMVMTCTGATGTITGYRNGTQVGQGASSSLSSSTQFAIGMLGGSGGQYFTGKIKDARIYDYPLSSAEIAALYALGKNPAATPRKTFPFAAILQTATTSSGW